MVTHLKFWNWSKSPALLLQVNYNIELEQHDLEKHWSEEFSYPLSEFSFCHCRERDSPSGHHTVVQNRMRKRVVF